VEQGVVDQKSSAKSVEAVAAIEIRRGALTVAADPQRFFTERHGTYARFIRLVRYPQGLRAFFLTSPLLGPGLRILDAGCGTGALTLAVWDALAHRGFSPAAFHAFDLTPAMLDRLRERLQRRAPDTIELRQANVLHLDELPTSWEDYDLVVSASMLEYVPRGQFVRALEGLRARLRKSGTFVLFITRRNALTRFLIGRWWASNLYTAAELRHAFAAAGFADVTFRRFPVSASHLAPWGHIVEAHVS
jgi:SAM-dependent methyltransferase